MVILTTVFAKDHWGKDHWGKDHWGKDHWGKDHWGGWGKFGYKVKVHHPHISGWHWTGPSSGWTSFYDTSDKSPKGWGHKEDHHKGWGWK